MLLESKEIETYLSRSLLTEGSWLWMGREADVEKEVERNKFLTRRIIDNNISLPIFAGFGFSRHILRLHVPPRGGPAGRRGHRAEQDQEGTEGGN